MLDAATPWLAGLYTGLLADGTGVFALDVDDEGATLVVESDGGCVIAECVVLYCEDGVVVVMTEEGGVFRLIPR